MLTKAIFPTVNKRDYKSVNTVMIILAIGITGLLSFLLVFNQSPSVWFDEVFSINIFSSDWNEMWTLITEDTHPPLYYYIMKMILTIFGNHYQVIKMAQLIPVFTLHLWSGILVLKNKKMIRNLSSGILTVLFIFATFAPKNFLSQNVQIRMYSWAMFFVTMSGIYAFRLIQTGFGSLHDSVFFITFVLAAALTHYFALLCEFFICLMVFAFIWTKSTNTGEKLNRTLKLFVPIIIGYIWWLPFAWRQLRYSRGRINWINFSFSNLPNILNSLTGFNILFVILFVGITIMEAYHSILLFKDTEGHVIKPKFAVGLMFVSMPFLMIVICVFVSVMFRPFLLERYLFPSLGLMWLGMILLLGCIKEKKRILILYGILAGALLFLLLKNYPKKLLEVYNSGSKTIVQYIEKTAAGDDILVTDIPYLGIGNRGNGKEVSVLKYHFPDHPVTSRNDFLSEIDTFDGIAWWFVDEKENVNFDEFSEHGLTVEEIMQGNFGNVYDFILYKIYRS